MIISIWLLIGTCASSTFCFLIFKKDFERLFFKEKFAIENKVGISTMVSILCFIGWPIVVLFILVFVILNKIFK